MASLPTVVNVNAIDERHPEWLLRNALWEKSAILYEGGQRLFESCDMFLRKKPKELSDVFVIRKQNLSYTNLLDQIVGWFIAALWKVPPTFAKNSPRAQPKPGEASRIPIAVEEFCARWEGNCDACFMKGRRVRERIFRDRPDLAAWWVSMEDRIGGTFIHGERYASTLARVRRLPLLPLDLEPEVERDESIDCACTDRRVARRPSCSCGGGRGRGHALACVRVFGRGAR